jgi:hypothetical protein
VKNVRPYPSDSSQAKIRDQGVCAEIILDLRPFNTVNRPGALWHSMALDPNYEVKTAKYYTNLCDKVFSCLLS